jgi:two-component system, NarL family, invasion response regulator UvrY
MSGVRVLTVHHEEGIRRAALAVVSATPGFKSVGEASSAEEALELAVALRPTLALVGLNMPGIDGLETSARLVAALPDTTVVLLYDSTEPSGNAVADVQAATAVQTDSLTPESLQALWEERSAG